ncbi:MAG TPA: hypothetical protein VGS60_17595 [Actinomycetes bacterium]|nr:hypothetical protein [Actinomycetes bacterium]
MPAPRTSRLVRARRLVIAALAGLLLGIGALWTVTTIATPRRTTPLYDPPVLAGQQIPGYCSGGVYARHGDAIVLTSSPHCRGEGTVVGDQGVVGPMAQDPTCPHVGYTCHASDMNYLVVAADRIPWGHLNVIDLGVGGYRILDPDAKPLGCDEVAIGDPTEVDGRNIYRTGIVVGKGENLQPPAQDGSYFPCMIVSTIQVGGGDSGSVVLVRGAPAGVTSRTFGGNLGFTPLAEGLADLGLDLCTTPDCGLVPPVDEVR